ncbi:MAG: hypothetical protein E6Q32_04940 [Neisseriales bacterium]|nr:MAG: hypothetical protein E6Q32_04940 [Neisseriales bacterium]
MTVDFYSIGSNQAIDDIKNDKFALEKHIKQLSKYIQSILSNSDCFFLGIYGTYGSGKTSFVNLVIKELKSKKIGDDINILNFNPWEYNNSQELCFAFYKELFSKLDFKSKTERENAAKFILQTVANFSSDLIKKVPSSVTEILPSYAKLGIAGVKQLASLLKSKKESNSELKEKINTYIAKNKAKTIVVLDDLDRLAKDELINLFKFLRLNADFSNVLYLLLLDKNMTEKLLCEQFNSKYVDKFIDAEYFIPQINHKIILSELTTYFNFLNKSTPYGQEFLAILSVMIGTMRDFKIIVNSFEILRSIFYNDNTKQYLVNLEQLFMINLISRFDINSYFQLRDEYCTVILSTAKEYLSSSNQERFSDNLMKICEEISTQQNIQTLIFNLFTNSMNFAETQNVLSKDISNPFYYKMYFGIIENEVVMSQDTYNEFETSILKNDTVEFINCYKNLQQFNDAELLEMYRTFIESIKDNYNKNEICKWLTEVILSNNLIMPFIIIDYFHRNKEKEEQLIIEVFEFLKSIIQDDTDTTPEMWECIYKNLFYQPLIHQDKIKNLETQEDYKNLQINSLLYAMRKREYKFDAIYRYCWLINYYSSDDKIKTELLEFLNKEPIAKDNFLEMINKSNIHNPDPAASKRACKSIVLFADNELKDNININIAELINSIKRII